MVSVDPSFSRRASDTKKWRLPALLFLKQNLSQIPSKRLLKVAIPLICGDVLVAVICMLVVDLLIGNLIVRPGTAIDHTFVLGLLIACLFGFGLYRRDIADPIKRLRRRVLAIIAFVVVVLILGLPHAVAWQNSFFNITYAAVFMVVSFYVELYVRGRLSELGLWELPASITGPVRIAGDLCGGLNREPELRLGQAEHLVDPDKSFGSDCNSSAVPVWASRPDLDRLGVTPVIDVMKSTGQQIHLDDSYETDALVSQPISSPFTSSLLVKQPPLGSFPAIQLADPMRSRQSPFYPWIKRTFDLLASFIIGLFSLPIIGALFVIMKIFFDGPVLFAQKRVGKKGRTISVFKIRSMHIDAEARLKEHLEKNPSARIEWERYFKLRDDPRVLGWLGKFIRRSSIDELPQLWNIIRGDMSLVGPRPFPSYHLNGFDLDVRKKRASVLPGLTGLWQISARSDGDTIAQQTEDLFYVDHQSIWLDLYIMLMTVPAVLRARGAR